MGVWPRRRTLHQCTGFLGYSSKMDAIRKKMQSMKAETDDLYKKINEYETAAKEANGISDKYDAEIRDMGKKVAKLECSMEETLEKLQTSSAKMEEAEKVVKSAREWESKTLNNEVEIEELDKQMREARRIGHDNEMKYDNLARSLSMMEDELKRADERVETAEARVVV